MALTRKLNKSASANAAAPVAAEPVAETKVDAQLAQTIAQLMQMVQTVVQKMAELETKLSEVDAKADAIREDLDNLDLDDEADEAEETEDEEDGEEEDDGDVTADEIDPKKVRAIIKSLTAKEQQKVFVTAGKALGRKGLNASSVDEPEVALAMAEVLCGDEFGTDVEEVLKD